MHDASSVDVSARGVSAVVRATFRVLSSEYSDQPPVLPSPSSRRVRCGTDRTSPASRSLCAIARRPSILPDQPIVTVSNSTGRHIYNDPPPISQLPTLLAKEVECTRTSLNILLVLASSFTSALPANRATAVHSSTGRAGTNPLPPSFPTPPNSSGSKLNNVCVFTGAATDGGDG